MTGQLSRYASSLCALLVLYVAIVGRIPTSACHCHEKKQQSSSNKESKKACAFGQARSLASSILLDAPTSIPEPLVALLVGSSSVARVPASSSSILPFDSRAPPKLL
jgi:hypothetical protein